MEINKIHLSDALAGLKTLPDNSINCCVTSPPYFGLRDYGTAKWEGGDPDCKHFRNEKNNNSNTVQKIVDGGISDAIYKKICNKCGAVRIDDQIGLEKTPDEYVEKIVQVFQEVKRVLKPEGTLWLNLGDSYNGSGGLKEGQPKYPGRNVTKLKPKDLIGIPWMVAFALRNDGWYLRQDIIWGKLNPMPESVTDRCTKAHEYIFLLSKAQKYYYDYKSILEPAAYDGRKDTVYKGGEKDVSCFKHERWKNKITPGSGGTGFKGHSGNYGPDGELLCHDIDGIPARNKRSVWTVSTKPYKEAHFATFPEKLIVDSIKAGCPEGGIVLDPFMGAGTTALVARKLNRNFIGFELNQKYIDMANKRLYDELGMFL